MICNGYYGVIYNNIYDGLLNVPEETVELINLHKLSFFNDCQSEVVEVALDFVKSNYKVYKATHKIDKRYPPVMKIKNSFINIEYFLNVIDTLEHPVIYVSDNAIKPIIIKADNGMAVILPIQSDGIVEERIVEIKE